MLVTLELNGAKIRYTQVELITLGLSAADGKIDYDGILTWLREHGVKC